MMEKKESANKKPRQARRLKEYWALSNQILELAGNGYPRPQFLKDVSRLLLRSFDCDVVGLVFREGGRQFQCRVGREPEYAFRFEQITARDSRKDDMKWSAVDDDTVERLCHDIISKKFDSSVPYFTDGGSFWFNKIEDVSIDGFRPAASDSRLGINIHADFNSMALIPFHLHMREDRVGLLELRSRQTDFFDERQIELFEQMSRTIANALTHRRLHVALRERVKELTCLYGISKLVQRPNINLDYILQESVKLLPPGWLYPEIASARIVLDDQVYITPNFGQAVHTMKADIIVREKTRGYVELRYGEERPPLDDGPFLREERNLIDQIAQELTIIIEQMEAEEEKSKLQEQLRHADRLATLGQLVAGVAHELNEPLANVLGFAQLAGKDPAVTDQVRNDLDKIVTSALHAREVIQRLLMSAKDASRAKSRFNLNSLINDGLYFLKSRCVKSGIELICELADDLPPIFADRSQFMQVLTNLVVNAVQAMPYGGKLTIKTEAGKGHIILVVEDTGVGMTREVWEKIFDPFFTTKETDQGTGLGLPIVQGIVSSHGGEIKVESEVGSGSRFIIRLPVESS